MLLKFKSVVDTMYSEIKNKTKANAWGKGRRGAEGTYLSNIEN